MNKRTVGSRYEKIAAAFLQHLGMELITMNYRCRFGEIDLILKDEDVLVFCEVKYRADRSCGFGEDHVDIRKQRTIYRVAEQYLTAKGLTDCYCRFDVVAVDGDSIKHIKNAFEKR